MKITKIDHLVLTVGCIQTTCRFYEDVLGMRKIDFAGGRKALVIDGFKINLHLLGSEIAPHALRPTAGSADICLITDSTVNAIKRHLDSHRVQIELGPVPRTGANGPIYSFYFRDPDNNLIELSTYVSREKAGV